LVSGHCADPCNLLATDEDSLWWEREEKLI